MRKYNKWHRYNNSDSVYRNLSDIHSDMYDDILQRQLEEEYQEQQLMMYSSMGNDLADYIQAVVDGIGVRNNQIVFDVKEVKEKSYSMQLASLLGRELAKAHIKMLQDMFDTTEKQKKKK